MFDPQVGDYVCDCQWRHLRVTERNGDDLKLEDDSECSLKHCVDDPEACYEFFCPTAREIEALNTLL